MAKTESEIFKESALDSIQVAFEIFNRPHEIGRKSMTVMLLHHSFEMLLKAAILKQGGKIRPSSGENTDSFSSCVEYARSGQEDTSLESFLGETDASSLNTLEQNRNAVVHEYVDLNEHQVYLQARKSVNIFDKLLDEVFDEKLGDYLPERVLPLSTRLPQDILSALDSEYSQVEDLLDEGEDAKARAKLRGLESFERAVDGDTESPSKDEMDEKLEKIQNENSLEDIFPSIVEAGSIQEGGEGEQRSLPVEITDEGHPVRYVPEDEVPEDEEVNIFREVNPHDRFSLGITDLGPKVVSKVDDEVIEDLPINLSVHKVKTVCEELGIHDDEDYYRELSTGGTGVRKAYHPRTIDRVVEAIETEEVDVEEAWNEYKGPLWGH